MPGKTNALEKRNMLMINPFNVFMQTKSTHQIILLIISLLSLCHVYGQNCPALTVTLSSTGIEADISISDEDNTQYMWYVNNNFVASGMGMYLYNGTLANGDKVYCKVTYLGTSMCVTGSPATSNEITISTTPTVQPSLSIEVTSGTVFCVGDRVYCEAVTTGSFVNFKWRLNGGIVVGANSSNFSTDQFTQGSVISVTADVENPCQSCVSSMMATTESISFTVNNPPIVSISSTGTKTICSTCVEKITVAPIATGNIYHWYKDGDIIANEGGSSYNATSSGTYSASVFKSGCASVRKSDSFILKKNIAPIANAGADKIGAFHGTPLTLSGSGTDADGTIAAYSWRQISGHEVTLTNTSTSNLSISNINYAGPYVFGLTVTDNFGESSKEDEVVITDLSDFGLNWIESISYDPGSARTIVDTRFYFDLAGKALQTQSKSFESPSSPDTPLIFASQTLQDNLGRDALSTLSAPTFKSDFQYDHFFVRSSSTNRYEPNDFDASTTKFSPTPINQEVQGTLGWYYSANNTVEKNVPVTGYPYSRTEFYDDGTGEIRRSAGPGDLHRMGGHHEMINGTFPVYQDLDDYLNIRREKVNLPDNLLNISSLVNKGVQTISRDQNGKYAIAISDNTGKTIMTARNGDPDNYELKVQKHIVASAIDLDFFSVSNNHQYFSILNSQAITFTNLLSNSSYYIEDLLTNTIIYNSETDVLPETWPVGFYRITMVMGAISIDYFNYYLDVSYQFYNDVGRLITSISPNGFNQLKNGVDYSKIDKTTYIYNHRGWLLSMTEPDAGTTKYIYRKDGKIRFSQNATQSENEASHTVDKGKFSYTNYDQLGRPVESGEYTGTLSFTGLSNNLEFADQINFVATEKKDWVHTNYDLPYSDTDISVPNLPSQDFLRGAVSWAENENIKTLYNYDEFGRVTYMIQKPKALTTRIFCVRYQYDLLGNVLMVSNLGYNNSILTSEFYHHYEYDKNQRLKQAFTSVQVDGEKKLRATYEYYLHGPLKRIVLGDKLQGIDFVYNINGWLTQINHPDVNQDPGKDGTGNGVRKDVFGMVLDYYESDLNNLFATSTGSIHDPARRHRLPFANETAVASNQQPLIRFESPAIYKDESVVPFKAFSAQSPAYKNMLQSKKEN
jgi:hypothetical protein